MVADAQMLAELLREQRHTAPAHLRARILNDVSELAVDQPSSAERFVDALSSWLFGAVWRPAVAAAIPLVLGFAIGVYAPEDATDITSDVDTLMYLATVDEIDNDF